MPRELVTTEGKVAWIGRTTLWGEVKEQHSHKEYGTDCTMRFPGQWYDEESRLCYNWHRYYDPETARYITPDPLGLAGGPNQFAYVPNPMVWIDPFGLTCSDPRWDQTKKAWVDANGNVVQHPTSVIGPQETQHILYGDKTGGGHMSGADIANSAVAGKSQFPASWSESDVAHAISSVATDPASSVTQQTGAAGSLFTKNGAPSKFLVNGTYNGVNMNVITEPAGRGIVTGFPIK